MVIGDCMKRGFKLISSVSDEPSSSEDIESVNLLCAVCTFSCFLLVFCTIIATFDVALHLVS